MSRNNQLGYTLIELLIAIQFLAILLTLVYTIYLFSTKFMDRWRQNNALLRTYILTEKVMMKKITSIRYIYIIDNEQILFKDFFDKQQIIQWKDQNLYINSRALSTSDVKIILNSLMFYIKKENMVELATFLTLDLNDDRKLTPDELKNLKGMEFNFTLQVKRKSEKLKIFYLLTDMER